MADQRTAGSRPPRWFASIAIAIILVAAAAVALTRFAAPRILEHYDLFPEMAAMPKETLNAKGAPGDPINVAIIGSETEVAKAFVSAGWREADSLSRGSKIAIAKSVLLNRPDSTAPVSPLFLFGRPQDVAYEREVGNSARRRHHVRLWRADGILYHGRTVWIGGATYDLSAGISRRGFRPTHHIAPDIDQERDGLEAALASAGQAQEGFRVTGIGIRLNAHNAEGDRYDTDGEMRVVVIPPGNIKHASPSDPGVPFAVAVKDRIWALGHRFGRPHS